MINLAGHPRADEHCREELRLARIEAVTVARYGEPQTTVAGRLGGIEFHRAWYYWIAKGRVPLDVARRLYEDPIGRSDVRVSGYAGNTPPEGRRVEWFDGDERVVVDPDGSEAAEYAKMVERGHLGNADVPRFAKSADGLQGYVTSYHIDSLAGLRLFADAVRP